MKKRIKKYEWGTFSASGDNPQMANPGNANLNQIKMSSAQTQGMPISTSSVADPNAKSLSGMKQFASKEKVPSFMDKAGDFMGSYGNIIGSVGTGMASLINANKKQDPTGRPYKTGTNMIKYQKGTEAAKNAKYILDKNIENDVVNHILVANAMNAKRNAELNSRVAPKKLEGKKATVKTDSLKTNKPNLIKYQAGAEDIIGPGPLDNLPEMSPKQLKEFNDYESKKEIKAAIERVDAMGPPVTPLSPKIASLNIPQIPMSVKPSPVSTPEKLSRRERKQENERLFKMAIKGDNIEYMTPKTPKLNINIPDKQPIMKMVEQQPVTAKTPKMFDYTSKEAKGGYARALKGGRTDAKGNLIDMETGLIYKDLRKTNKGGNKPLIKTNTPEGKITGKEMVLMSKQGKAINPYAMAGFKTPFNQPAQQKNKVVQKPTQTLAQIDSAINSINLPRFKGKNTLHPLEYKSK